MKHVRLVAAALLLAPTLLFAQAQGRVKGTVVDSQGKPIVGAKVIVTCPDLNAFRKEMATGADGTFSLLVVDATKNYMFHVEAPGFQTIEQLNKPKIGGQTLELTFELKSFQQLQQEAETQALEQPGLKQLQEGKELLDAGNKDAALAKFQEAVKLRPDLHLGWLQIGLIKADQGANEEALADAKKCLDASANFSPCLALAANASKSMGDQESYDKYMAAYKMYNPQDPVVLFNEAVEFLNKGDDAQAKPLLEEALEVKGDFADALYQLGMINVRAGDNAKAKELLQKFIETAPDSPDAATAKEMLKYL